MIRKLKSGGYRLYSRKTDPKTGKRRNLGTFPRGRRRRSTSAPSSSSSGAAEASPGACIISSYECTTTGIHAAKLLWYRRRSRSCWRAAEVTPDLVMKLGWAAGRTLVSTDGARRGDRPGVLIGKDTRISGYLMEAALEAGLSAAGVDVYLCGPLPTPGVAYLTRALRLSAGIVISASHNPFDDNGMKFFSAAGAKLPDEVEASIERRMNEPLTCVSSAALGKAYRVDDAGGRYVEFFQSTFPSELDLHGVRIVVDCANSAAYHVAPPGFHELRADVVEVACEPDGLDVDAGYGATHPEFLAAKVREHGRTWALRSTATVTA